MKTFMEYSCNVCGRLVQRNDKFCPRCGTTLKFKEEEISEKETVKNSQKIPVNISESQQDLDDSPPDETKSNPPLFKNTFEYTPFYSFEGRIGRREFLAAEAGLIIAVYTFSSGSEIVYTFLPPIILWLFLAIRTKRCHDVGLSGWWQLIPLFDIFLLFKPGELFRNKYGPPVHGEPINESTEGTICSICGTESTGPDNCCLECGGALPGRVFNINNTRERLSPISAKVLDEILEIKPEWERYASANKGNVLITLPSFIKEETPIQVRNRGRELTVYYGAAHIHSSMYNRFILNPVNDQVKAVAAIVEKILSEDLISARQKNRFSLFYNYGLITPESYSAQRKRNKIAASFSWSGTYNFPAGGQHKEWFINGLTPLTDVGVHFDFSCIQVKVNHTVLFVYLTALLSLLNVLYLIRTNPNNLPRESREDLALVRSPQVGDVYKIFTDEKLYSLARVDRLSEDSVYLRFNNLLAYDPKQLAGVSRMEGFVDPLLPYGRDYLVEMYFDGHIIDVERKWSSVRPNKITGVKQAHRDKRKKSAAGEGK